MSRTLALSYGVACYLVFLAAFLYAVGFVGNLLVPTSVDSGLPGPLSRALLTDILLLLVLAVPHRKLIAYESSFMRAPFFP